MMRSLNAGVSGLRVHQTKMDVIGNNIANVNTIGFKASTVNFTDVFYQTTQKATGPNPLTGSAGRNPLQIGMGTNIGTITKSIEQPGGTQRTDEAFDLMINGNSFFIVNSGGTNYFTKAGSFGIDPIGNLCTPNGALVMGWQVDPNDPTRTVADEVSSIRILTPENMYAPPVATTNVHIAGNIDSKDTQVASETGKSVSISFFDGMGYSYSAQIRIRQSPTSSTNYSVSLSNVTDERGKSIFVSEHKDENGNTTYSNSDITSFNFGGVTYEVDVNEEDGSITLKTQEFDENGNPVYVDEDGNVIPLNEDGSFMYTNGAGDPILVDEDGNPVLDGDGNPIVLTPSISYLTGENLYTSNLSFNGESGEFHQVAGYNGEGGNGLDFSINADPNPFSNINIDFSSITMQGTNGNSSLEAGKGDLEGQGSGRRVGSLSGFGIDTAGRIYGAYDNGDSRLLGQIAVASFANPAGLEAVGNNMFAQTQNSGEFDGIGQDVSADGGSFTTGALEMSNVDLSAQFTDMITTQRGYQANSRIITVSDTLLEELINLKR